MLKEKHEEIILLQNPVTYSILLGIELIVFYLVISSRAEKWHGKILQIGKYISVGLILLFIPLVLTYFAKIVSEKNNIFRFFTEGLWAEAFGIIFTIVVLDRLASNRDREALKKRLIREAGSQSNETAKAAIDWLREEKWLNINHDIQLLKGQSLVSANLKDVDLTEVDLRQANIQASNLENVILLHADLQDADLFMANLENAFLFGTNLTGANLGGANLRGATLWTANIDNVNWESKIANVIPNKVDIVSTAILPDGTKWTSDTDMERFTNIDLPNRWRDTDFRKKLADNLVYTSKYDEDE